MTPYYDDGQARFYLGDVRDVLRELPEQSAHMCVTSPPYLGLRDYGVAGQLGLEPTPEEYVANMVGVFREVRRVLRDDGTLWLNIGDSYAGGAGGRGDIGNVIAGHQTRTTSVGPGRIKSAVPAGLKAKDLIGVPWMLAFALRAPYEHVQIKDRIDRAWLAALVDGEGTMTVLSTTSPHGSGNSYPPVLQVRMCDPQAIEHAAKITGYGNASPRQDPPSQGGQRGSYQWRLNGRKAADIAAEIYPYLLIKRKQAVVIWNHQKVRESYETKRGVTIPAAALEKQKACRDIIQRLNRAEHVDLPSWMEEPSIRVEPGWYLRSDCIWAKPNPMPESVTDRPTKSHEYLFLLSKRERYWYDAKSIAEPYKDASLDRMRSGWNGDNHRDWPGGNHNNMDRYMGRTEAEIAEYQANGRNKRDVWTIATQPYPEAHFATYPEELVEPCILAGCPEGGTVLDPFLGSGTTIAVAKRLGRKGIGIELNPTYIELAKKRCAQMGIVWEEPA